MRSQPQGTREGQQLTLRSVLTTILTISTISVILTLTILTKLAILTISAILTTLTKRGQEGLRLKKTQITWKSRRMGRISVKPRQQ